jgi:excinuclease UvrABC nuclease subunit
MPALSIEMAVPADPAVEPEVSALPAAPGVFLFEGDSGGCLSLAITANLRRLVRARLQPHDAAGGPTRRIDYRRLTRTVRAATVGSAFEADWAYLQMARQRLPTTYASILDHWQGWFVHVNPQARFPRWVKTAHPFAPPTGRGGVHIGPMADKHAAARYIEAIEDGFDLCRYYHILLESPRASACAYKEMGRCPAPCDGSISMDEYRSMMHRAAEFAAQPVDAALAKIEADMADASRALAFERAEKLRTLALRLAPLKRAEFTHARAAEDFRYLGIYPSEAPGWARLFLILGGWVEPVADVSTGADASTLDEVLDALAARAAAQPPCFEGEAAENVGLICRHLFRPSSDRRPGELVPLEEALQSEALRRALRRLRKRMEKPEEGDSLPDQVMEAFCD